MALDPLCELCKLQSIGIDPAFCPEETAIHLFEECPAFSILKRVIPYIFYTNASGLLNKMDCEKSTRILLVFCAQTLFRTRCDPLQLSALWSS